MDYLTQKFEAILSHTNIDEMLQQICDLLKKEKTSFDWVGFYFKNGDKNELKLGPYAGLATDHDIIPFGKGICGQVALSNETFVVPDVMVQDNYLSCNINVKSEIVVPLFVFGQNIGQIDIDSNTINAFTEKDEELLKGLMQKVGEKFEKKEIKSYY